MQNGLNPAAKADSCAEPGDVPSIFEYANLRDFLFAIYAHRHRKNTLYSRNSFARSVGLSPATIHYILNGTRALSPEKAAKVAEKLQLGAKEENFLRLLAELALTRDEARRKKLAEQIANARKPKMTFRIAMDDFSPISRWFVFGLLEICAIGGVTETSLPRVAQGLGATPEDAVEALDRLQVLGLIRRDESGTYCRVPGEVVVESSSERAPLDRYHEQMLLQAKSGLAKCRLDERVYGSGFFSIRKERIPELREKIYALLDEFHEHSLTERRADSVYALSTSFFKIYSMESSS